MIPGRHPRLGANDRFQRCPSKPKPVWLIHGEKDVPPIGKSLRSVDSSFGAGSHVQTFPSQNIIMQLNSHEIVCATTHRPLSFRAPWTNPKPLPTNHSRAPAGPMPPTDPRTS